MSIEKQNVLIDELINNKELPPLDKFNLFIHLVDAEKIIKVIQTKAALTKMGMIPEDVVTQFAYMTLRITRPELFEQEKVDAKSNAPHDGT